MLGSIDRLTDRVIRRVTLSVLAAGFGVASFGTALAALYYWLILWMSISEALIAVALLLCVAALLIARFAVAKPPTKLVTEAVPSQNNLISGLLSSAGNIANDAVKADPLGAMLGAGAAGFILETRSDIDQAVIHQILRQFIGRSI